MLHAGRGRRRATSRRLKHGESRPRTAGFHEKGLGSDRMATCLYAVYDPVAHRITIANAGHPPP
ncbi:SpoIIE family protein phosphatase, partial [Streptomyces sp. NPDC093023]|uniref:SpoIIE family protein phosphatase n=1 Tax=Streptomyces sp. NPDC093023 TaxID=3156672 RepID=UPI00343B3B39